MRTINKNDTSLILISITALYFLGTTASADENDVTALNYEQIDLVKIIAATNEATRTHNDCRKACTGKGLDGDVACLDWCRCKYVDGQTTNKCDEIYTDAGTTRPDDVYSVPPLEGCSNCALKAVSTKTCRIEDFFGREEPFVFTASCDTAVPDGECGACRQALSFEQVCCENGDCAATSCAIGTTFAPPSFLLNQ
jgi:hypothetical protein